MVGAMAADMEVHMVADMEVDKVADKVADKVVDMVADKVADIVALMFADIVTKLGVRNLARREWVPFFLLTKLGTPNLMRELVTGVGKLSPNFFDPTCVSYKVCKFIHFLLHLCFVASAFVHCSYIRFLNLSLTHRAKFSLEKQTFL